MNNQSGIKPHIFDLLQQVLLFMQRAVKENFHA